MLQDDVLTDAMLGLVEKTGADAQVNRGSVTEIRRMLQYTTEY